MSCDVRLELHCVNLLTVGYLQDFRVLTVLRMALSDWKPLPDVSPSPAHRGESETSVIHTAVGFALSQWEHMESGLARLFQLLCESPAAAAARAYGTVESSYSKEQLLRGANDAFFHDRNATESELYSDLKSLFTAYNKAQQFRNNIAHGMTVQWVLQDRSYSGYFLCPPVYATKKTKKKGGHWPVDATYWYKTEDVRHYAARFTELLAETMRLIQAVNGQYRVLKDAQFRL
jgi:hypothetical protein